MFARLRSFARTLFGRDRFDRELQDEMTFHIEARAEDLVRTGLDREAATRRARMEFGTVDAIRDDCRQSRGVRWIDEFAGDVRYALRLMRKSPGFTAAAVLSLGLGIGANTAIFSLTDAVLLRTLHVSSPHELVYFAHGSDPDTASISSNYPLYERYRSLDRQMFDGVTAYSSTGFTVETADGLDMVSGLWASGNFHAVLGVPMAAGRGFAAERDRDVGGAPIVVISDAFWARRFARDREIVGRTIIVDGRALTVVGVTAPQFTGPIPGLNPDMTIPLSVRAVAEPGFLDDHGTYTNLSIVGRLRSGVSHAAALAATEAVFQQYMSEPENGWIRKDATDYGMAQLPPAGKGRGQLRRQYETALTVLMGMVAIVLLIAAVNVANLMLVRGGARAKEVAIRLCIGGRRARLVRQFLTESMLLALCGGVLGLLFAIWGTGAIMSLFSGTETPLLLDVSPNLRVLAFTTAVTALTGLGFGVVPAIKATNVDLTPALKGAATSGRLRRWSTSHLLVGTQVALSVLVLAVAGLLVRSLINLRSLDTGFVERRLLLVTLETNGTPVTPEQRPALFEEVLDRLRAVPGVRAVSGSRSTPIHTSGNARALALPNAETMRLEDQLAFTNMVTPGYFDTMGIALLRGRQFDARDRNNAPAVAIVNETMARFWAGDRDPIGMTFAFRSEPTVLFTIVGVVSDTRQMSLRQTPPRIVYTPLAQVAPAPSLLQIVIRTAGSPAAAASQVRNAVRAVSNDLVIRYMRTMDQQIDASLVRERLLSTLSAAFALLALVLSAVGLYGVMSYSVARRSREIGIRMALGAARGQVLRQVLGQTLIIAVIGIAVGLAGALAVTQTLSTFLFGLTGRDPITLASVTFALLMVSMLAGLLPARKAATLNPVQAIKAE